MENPIHRPELFPFICSNVACKKSYDAEAFIEVVNHWGLAYADCNDNVYQGITCPACRKTTVYGFPRANPLVDLRDFIMVPHLKHPEANTVEQLHETLFTRKNSSLLKFRFIQAWTNNININDILAYSVKYNWKDYIQYGIPYIIDEMELKKRIHLENKYNKKYGRNKYIRRLYPDTNKFRNLILCLNPERVTGILPEGGVLAEGNCPEDLVERENAWRILLEEAHGSSFATEIGSALEKAGYAVPTEKEIHDAIRARFFLFNYQPADFLREEAETFNFEETIWSHLKSVFDNLLNETINDVVYHIKRQELSEWVNQIEKGKALFVDAPMGLGKTHSIIRILSDYEDFSAIIFMPTNKMCMIMFDSLKANISFNKIGQNKLSVETYHKNFNERDFLKDEIYYLDGINKKEGLNFNDIVYRYSKNCIKKRDICNDCEKNNECRFLSHWKYAPLARIIVTTHHQYQNVYRRGKSAKLWYKYGYDKEDEAVERTSYIIDEDLVISQCYNPIQLKYKELKDVTATISNFVSEFDIDESKKRQIDNSINTLLGKISSVEKSCIIPPIDKKFTLPTKLTKAWDESFHKLRELIPDTTDESDIVGNHLELLRNAIRLGVTVQKHSALTTSQEGEQEVFKIHFPNTLSYNLSNLPPHVFFDGTKLSDNFLSKKLRKIEFKTIKIDINPLWNLRVWQNINTNLPKKTLPYDEPRVKEFVSSLVEELGKEVKYFFLPAKHIREVYLEEFIKEMGLDCVLEHFGNLRGINEAKDCTVGVMLGSYLPSDAVEVAMVMEFIQDKFTNSQPMAIYPNLWKWKNSNSVRVYEDEFAVVGEMANAYRLSEHRQGIARTRPLLHDVDFYVLSKDLVSDYEPMAMIQESQYRSDIFRSRPRRVDSEFESVQRAVFEWLETHPTATIAEITTYLGKRRGTVEKHIKAMEEEGLLERNRKKYRHKICD